MKKISATILILSICLNCIFANVQDENFTDEIISAEQIEYLDISTLSGITSKVGLKLFSISKPSPLEAKSLT